MSLKIHKNYLKKYVNNKKIIFQRSSAVIETAINLQCFTVLLNFSFLIKIPPVITQAIHFKHLKFIYACFKDISVTFVP